MKWFKHMTKAHADGRLEKLISEHGVEGYGLYFYCLELIAGTIDSENISFELEHDSGLLARRLNMDTLKVEAIIKRCISLGLFEMDATGKIMCLKMAQFIDPSLIRNPAFKAIAGRITEVPELPATSGDIRRHPATSGARQDKTRQDKKRQEKEKTRRYRFGENVLLSLTEYEKIKQLYTNREGLKWAIKKLDVYISTYDRGKKYKSHYAVLRDGNWVHDEYLKRFSIPEAKPKSEFSTTFHGRHSA